MSNIGVSVAGPQTNFPSLTPSTGAVANTTLGAAQSILVELRIMNRLLLEIARGSFTIDDLTQMRLDEAQNIALAGITFAS